MKGGSSHTWDRVSYSAFYTCCSACQFLLLTLAKVWHSRASVCQLNLPIAMQNWSEDICHSEGNRLSGPACQEMSSVQSQVSSTRQLWVTGSHSYQIWEALVLTQTWEGLILCCWWMAEQLQWRLQKQMMKLQL